PRCATKTRSTVVASTTPSMPREPAALSPTSRQTSTAIAAAQKAETQAPADEIRPTDLVSSVMSRCPSLRASVRGARAEHGLVGVLLLERAGVLDVLLEEGLGGLAVDPAVVGQVEPGIGRRGSADLAELLDVLVTESRDGAGLLEGVAGHLLQLLDGADGVLGVLGGDLGHHVLHVLGQGLEPLLVGHRAERHVGAGAD